MGYPPERGRLSTRYSPVRHFTRPANRAFSCDLHVLGMPPALILSQDQTLQFYLEFSRTRTHYLVFKEQVLVITIVAISPPLSRGLFFASRLLPPRAAIVFVTQPGFRVNPSLAVYFPPRRANPAAFQATVIYIQSPPPCQAPFPNFFCFRSGPAVSRTIFSAHPRDRRYFLPSRRTMSVGAATPLQDFSGLPKNRPGITALPAPMLNQ